LGPDDAAYYISTSIGVATFTGSGNSAELLLKQADVALYQAKDAGRNLVRYFNPAMQAAIDERAEMETALQRALEEHELRLFYQPQTDHEGKTVGAEALVRWQRQDCLTPPNEFIPLAEESRLIIQIGQWVLDTACDQLVAWANDPRAAHLYLAVNVSARQFYQPDFVAQVKRCLVRSGANPKRLKLELTESVVLDQIDLVVHRMNELIELGLSFSLDDFGTGYSSLSYLKRLPLAQVKIDQSFVRDIPQDGNDASIIRAILAMNQSLGLSVVAEGVETPEQRDFLLQNGCRLYQGYLYGRPTPIEEWQKFLPQ
jgi:EAL domain-containing protein (putative c-di-GMP-specific phosphodiesterase class I)